MTTLTAQTVELPAPVTDTYLDEPPAYDFKEVSSTDRKDLLIDSRSINSASSDTTTVVPTRDFEPTKTLLVNARGIRFIRLPMPSGQLEIPITDKDGNLIYTSTRTKKCSGNAVLTDASGAELLASEYQFGPGRDPKIHVLNGTSAAAVISEKTSEEKPSTEQILTKGKWTSRRQDFVLPGERGTFTWRYVKERDAFASATEGKDKKKTHLVLEISAPNTDEVVDEKATKKNSKLVRRVAELVRNAEARTPGTSATDSGNGGQLRIDAAFAESVGLCEEVIVVSCLMMLKKEIDRQRAIQAMIIAGVLS